MERKMFLFDNALLSQGMSFSDINGFPLVAPYNGRIDYDFVPFTCRKKSPANCAIHFFLKDYLFRGIWNNLDKRTMELVDFELLIAPDFSLWVNLPDYYNKNALFKNRFVNAYWNMNGIPTIPCASWGNADSFSYCFEGLPEQSIIAVSGMGHNRCQASKRLWQYGMRELEAQKAPTRILVYGDQEIIPGLQTDVEFIPCFITKTFRQ